MTYPVEEFRRFIAEHGFEPPPTIEPGKFARFSTNGKQKDTAGYAKLFPDFQGGIVGDFRTGESWTWQAKRDHPMSAAEARTRQEQIEHTKREAAAERAREQKETAKLAAELWGDATPADDSHPYLARKGVKAHGVRVYRGPMTLNGVPLDGALMVPARLPSGELASLSFILPSGQKRHLPGPKPPGCYFAMGAPSGSICIAEGYATGASVHEATGHAVAVAFDAGNLEAVAKALRAKYPGVGIVICGDHDESGTGQRAAEAAARAVGGTIALPVEVGTDWNDVQRAHGPDAVKRGIEATRKPCTPASAPSADKAPSLVLIAGESVQPEPVRWLWNGWIAHGKLHILAGAPSTGKTTIALSFAATVSSGGLFPDGSRCEPRDVVIWSGEDGVADTLAPRLIAMGANMSRIAFVGGVSAEGKVIPFDPARDLELLRDKLAGRDVGLLIVDPIVSAVAGDSHKNAEVRRDLAPLVELGIDRGCAVIGISHFTKGTAGRDPVERVTGSLAFGALARVVLATCKRSEEDGGGRLLARAKSNIGPDGGGFLYELEQVSVVDHPGLIASRVQWGEAIDGNARELLASAERAPDEDTPLTDDAEQFLREALADGRVWARDLKRQAADEGITDKALRRARERLGIKSTREGFGKDGKSYWQLPAVPSPSFVPIRAHENDGARMDTNGAIASGESDDEEIL